MTNTKFSEKLIEAGQNLQQVATELREAERRTEVAPPFITPATPSSPIVEGIGWTIEQAGKGLSKLGFDEAGSETFDPLTNPAPVKVEAATDSEVIGSIVNAFSPATSDPILNGAMADMGDMADTADTADTADYGKHPVTGEKIEQVSIDGGKVSLNGNTFRTSDYVKAAGIGTTLVGASVSAYSAASTPVTTILGVKGTALGGAIAAGGLATTLTGHIMGMAGLDEVEVDPTGTEFNSNPQTLTPIDLNSAMVTDAYQHQNAPGADLIAGEPNQGIDPYQAQREQYEVLA